MGTKTSTFGRRDAAEALRRQTHPPSIKPRLAMTMSPQVISNGTSSPSSRERGLLEFCP